MDAGGRSPLVESSPAGRAAGDTRVNLVAASQQQKQVSMATAIFALMEGPAELSLQRSIRQSHRLLDSRDTTSKDWFFADQLTDGADRNLGRLFTLLSLLLPADAVRIAFRVLHADDRRPAL